LEENSNISIKSSRTWVGNFLNPQTAIYIGAGIIALVVFWMRTKDTWNEVKQKADEKEVQTLREQIKDLDEKVTRQYSIQRDQVDNVGREVRKFNDWMNYKNGFEDALKQKK